MEVIKRKYSNADGEYISSIGLQTGDKLLLKINGEERFFRVGQMGTQQGHLNCYDNHICLTSEDKPYIFITIWGNNEKRKIDQEKEDKVKKLKEIAKLMDVDLNEVFK